MILRLVLFLLLATVAVALITPQIQAGSRNTPDHLRYASLEKSFLFSNSDHHSSTLYSSERYQPQQRKQQQQQQQETHQSPVSCTHYAVKNRSQDTPSYLNNRHSASDWLYNLKTIPNSSVLKEIRNPVLAVLGWSTLASLLHRILACSGKASLMAMSQNMCVPHSAHSFLVSSLGLLLVFRTNSAYQRFMVRPHPATYERVENVLNTAIDTCTCLDVLSFPLTRSILLICTHTHTHRRDAKFGNKF